MKLGWTFKRGPEKDVRMSNGFIWLRIGVNGGLL
jgi:hypothetical protein